MSEPNIMKANTSIKLECDWNGNFKLTDANGVIWHYKRDRWNECSKHMQSMIRPPNGDPKVEL